MNAQPSLFGDDPNFPIDNYRGAYWFLSNFSPSRILWRGKYWATIEHAFQAAKTDDEDWQERIRTAKTPGEANGLGKICPRRANWDAERVGIMRELLTIKFTDPSLRAKLLATGSRPLIEGNTWGDRFWGVCKGTGENMLGQLQMKISDEIRADES